ncbi:serine/threonine protein kinase, variant 2 [Aphanomyces astaci]|nr:serine/threonine protein kinase, variant 2 [Aphanomyces astaci]ETV86305.1 serine/threonine protein kinase, variant 2 [Aphanomyces astaci]|eukprot:XP_009824776.1 serine/threonine protein kinase, variant 2 [Aphanomyces astaci]
MFKAVQGGHVDAVQGLLRSSDLKDMQQMDVVVGGKPVVEECTPLMLASWLGHDGIVDLLVAYDSSLVNLANHNKTNALMLACMNNHWSAVQTLLSVASLDVNAINMDSHSALLIAVNNKNAELVHLLLTRADLQVNLHGYRGNTALILACASSSKNVVDALLSHHDIDVNMVDNSGQTALHRAAAAPGGSLIVQHLLQHPNLLVNKPSKTEETALHVAADVGEGESVIALLNHSAVDATCKDVQGRSPLMRALKQGHADIALALLATQSVTKEVNYQDKTGITALMVACQAGLLPVVDVMLHIPCVDITILTKSGCTALSYAATKGDARVVQALLGHPNGSDIVNKAYPSALFRACRLGFEDIVQLLLSRDDLDVHADINTMIDTPLTIAAEEGHANVVAILVQRPNLFPVNQPARKLKKTPLHCAATHGRVEVVQVLLRQGDVDVNAVDDKGSTAFLYAASRGSLPILQLLWQCPTLHSINFQDKGQCTALAWACEYHDADVVQFLLSLPDIDVNLPDENGHSPLLKATVNGSAGVVAVLLQHPQIQVNRPSHNMNTPLHAAANLRGPAIAELLLAHPSIDKSVVNRENCGPVQVAAKGGNYVTMGVLLANGLPFESVYKGTLLVVAMAPCMTPAAGVALLLRDLPVIVSATTPTPTIVATDKHHYSWTTFLDSSTPIKPEIRLETVQLVLDHPQFKALDRHSVVKELAFAADINGRTALQITDAATRTFLNEQLFFCGRYELFDGPPIHISSTAVVVNAFDYGMFKQVFDMHAAALDHHLDRDGFAKCSHALGQPSSQTTKGTLGQSDFDVWDKNHNGTLSEVEFMRYCDQAYGGKLKVAMKFMRNADEHAREIHMRRGLTKDDEENAGSPCVLRLLPMASQEAFECHVTQLTLHHDLHMAAYPNVLVMPAADRSLEDIYLKERPNDNQIRSMLQEVATMLGQLHSHDVVHGDVKKLNVLRVDHCMRLIDMDAATPVNHPIGAKFSSGSLPPEMFYKLKSEDEVAQYSSYWQQRNHPEKTKNEADDDDERRRHDPDWWAKVQPRHHWVVKTFHDKDHHLLPYTLVKATPAVDMWAFGVLMYQMYSGVELVPTDRNQDVDDSSIERAATWTPADLATRLQNKVANPVARDLLLKLLAVDPNDRISVHAMLSHAYFEIKQVDSTTKQVLSAIEAKLDTLNDHVVSGFQSMNDRLDLVVELTQDTLKQLGQAKEDLMRGIFQATEVRVPTSFVLLPFNILEKLADDDDDNDVEGALDEAASFIQKGLDMGAKFVKAVKTNKAINVVVKLVTPGAPLYLYLIDEVQGAPVVPPLDKASPPVYPIKIETKSDEYVAFMVTAMPYIQTGFKLLKGVNTVACMAKALGVPSLDADVLQGVQDKIECAKKTSSVFDFGVLQTAVEANDPGAPVHRIRGAALRQLERFFELHDPEKDFAGLGRTYAASGQVLWTAKSTIEAFERSKAQPKSANISFAGDIPMLLESGNKKTLTAQDVYAKLLRQQPPETTRK